MTTPSKSSSAPSPEQASAHSLPNASKAARSSGRRWLALVVVVGIAVPIGIWLTSGSTAGSGPLGATFGVAKGDLRVSVVETGSIRSEKPVKIVSQLEGQNTILKLIPEGTYVNEGDVIAELDASKLVESRAQQEITYEKAKASWISAQQTFEIQKSQNDSAIKAAELDAEFADTDYEKYDKGDRVQAKEQTEAEIELSKAELSRAQDRANWSAKLAAKGFISGSELDADKLSVKKCELDQKIAERKLGVLLQYTQPKDLRKLQEQAKEKKNELGRVKLRCEASLTLSEADLNSKKSTYELEKSRLEKWKDQIAKAVLRAPRPGMVVYASNEGHGGGPGRNDSPIQEGASVRERETIATLPDLTKMIADTKIHESALDRIKEGLDAIVQIDALPGRPFRGRVTKVALLPDVQQSWLNPDLKVYTTEITVVGDTTMLRPGMSCSVEVIVEELKDTLYVPIQAIQTRGRDHFALVAKANSSTEERPVEIGSHNEKFVEVTSGLAERELVLLASSAPRGQSKVLPRTGEDASGKPNELPPVPPGAKLPEPKPRAEGDRQGPPGGAGTRRQGGRPSTDMQERMKNMTPEEREKMRARFQKGAEEDKAGGGPGGDSGNR